ncbi:MAG: tetratricopeptide repeat protein [Vampirovibrionales bacterium]|nr:tetratricopeptide repeat protein [Vampirovibrionales bacterium]
MTVKKPLAGWYDGAPLSKIVVRGSDAASFLNGRLSSDVLALGDHQGQPTALLDRKAHVLAYGSLVRLCAEKFELWVHRALKDVACSQLQRFHITENLTITLEESPPLVWLLSLSMLECVFDNQALPLAALAPNSLRQHDDLMVLSGAFVAFGPFPAVGCLVSGPQQAIEGLIARLQDQHPEAYWSYKQYEAYRREVGLLLPSLELPADVLLPETGLERWTVSYEKGCYLGQETVARVKTYGKLQRLLGGVVFGRLAQASKFPPAGMRLSLPDGTPAATLCLAFEGELRKVPHPNPAQEQLVLGAALLSPNARTPGQVLISPDVPLLQAKVASFPITQPAVMAKEASKALVEQASKQFILGQLALAESMLNQALSLNPLCGDAYESLGVILGRQGRYEEAIALMHQLQVVDPACVMAHTNLSVFYQKQGRIEEAEIEKAKATTLAFQNAMRAKLPPQIAQKPLSPKSDGQDEKPTSTAVQTHASSSLQAPAPLLPSPPAVVADEAEAAIEKLRLRLLLFDQALQFSPHDKLALQGKASVLLQMLRMSSAIGARQDEAYLLEEALLIEAGVAMAHQLKDNQLLAQFQAFKGVSPDEDPPQTSPLSSS